VPNPSGPDLYALLGVEPGCSREELRAAYRTLARVLHPDRALDDPAAEARFRQVTEAYAALSSPTSRAEYDRARDRRRSSPVRLEPDHIDVLLRSGRSVTRRVSVVGDPQNLAADVTAGAWWHVTVATTSVGPTIEITFAVPADTDGELRTTVHLRHASGRLELPLRARVVRRRRVPRRVAA
jgi:hypothetical protein